MKALIERLTDAANLGITRKHRLAELKAREPAYFDLEFLKILPPDHAIRAMGLFERSTAQLRQDLFVLSATGFKQGGYFVEFGATDGRTLNNTWLLETGFGWQGLLAEPARMWHEDLRRNRACVTETRCVWKESGATLSFTEAPRGENSGLSQFMKASRKARGTSYKVETISLLDLLRAQKAPARIDYLSIDTEGSEFEILAAFDFSAYRFDVITVEHNFAPQRSDIKKLLEAQGYRRVHEHVSRFDDWYLGPDSAAG